MRFKQYIHEMAMPRELDLKKTYYHGTSKDKFGEGILKKGINPPDLTTKKKNNLTPVEGMVYITPNLEYALIYALGANMIGSKSLPDFMTKKGEENMYLFVIDGKQLKDIQPDEDSIGEMIMKKKPKWIWELADAVLSYDVMDRVMDGEYEYWAKAGKILLKNMTDEEKLKLIDAGAHIAHTGSLKPKEAWILPKAENHRLNKKGSNFFKIAKRIK